MSKMSHNSKIAPLNVSIKDLEGYAVDDFLLTSSDFSNYFKNASSVIFDGFIISLFTGRELSFRVNGKLYSATKGDILVLAPNMILEYSDPDCARESVKIITGIDMVMELPSPFDTDIIAAARRTPLVSPTPAELEEIEVMYSALATIYSGKQGQYRKEILKSLTFGIIYKLGEIYARMEEEMPEHSLLNDERLSDEFFRLLGKHYRSDRTVKFYASRMALTPKYLSLAIRRITGKTVHEWVDDAIILEIKNLLKTTDMTVLQISEELHFCSPSAFVHFFREHTGLTPYRYRHSEEW